MAKQTNLLYCMALMLFYTGLQAKPTQIDIGAAEVACQNDADLKACLRVATYYEKIQRPVKAAGAWEAICLGGDHQGCMSRATLATNPKDSMRWLRAACRIPQNRGLGCFHIAEIAMQTKASGNASRWYRSACEKGHQGACAKAEGMK